MACCKTSTTKLPRLCQMQTEKKAIQWKRDCCNLNRQAAPFRKEAVKRSIGAWLYWGILGGMIGAALGRSCHISVKAWRWWKHCWEPTASQVYNSVLICNRRWQHLSLPVLGEILLQFLGWFCAQNTSWLLRATITFFYMTLWPNFKVMWSKMAAAKKNFISWCIKSSRLHKTKLYTYKTIIYCGMCYFLMKKSSLGHYNYIFQIVWGVLGGTGLGWIADFSVKLSSAQKTVSLVSSKFVRRWRYHVHNWICGIAQMPYASWAHIKCITTWDISNTPYGSWGKLGRIGYALRRQRVKWCRHTMGTSFRKILSATLDNYTPISLIISNYGPLK
jgi:hypothetical protein